MSCLAGRLSLTSASVIASRTGKPRRAWDMEGKIVWLGGSRQRPTVVSLIVMSDG